MSNYTPLMGDNLWRTIKQMEQQEAMAKLSLAHKLAMISDQNDKTPKYNDKNTWTDGMLFNYQQVIDKAEAAALTGKRFVEIETQYTNATTTEHTCILQYLREIDEFKVITRNIRGIGNDYQSTLRLEW